MKKTILFTFCLIALAGCKTPDIFGEETVAPVTIGTDIHDLRRSPCACIEVEMKTPEFKNVG